MAGRVTIQDIADALGVSRNTVSKAINNTGILADSTREKILQKAIEMGYKQFSYVTLANPAAASAKTGLTLSSGTAGNAAAAISSAPNGTQSFAVPEPPGKAGGMIALFTTKPLGNSHFASTMIDKFQREISCLGYNLTMHRVSQSNLEQMTLPNAFNKEMTDGIICFEMFHPAYSDMVCELGLPVLFVDSPASICNSTLKADRLLMDNRSNIYAFVNEMVSRGKKRIGFIGEYLHCMSFFERYMAYREALSMLGIPCQEEFCIIGNNSASNPYPTTEDYQAYLTEQFRNLKELPDVFICANDFVAIDTLQVFRKLGISVPDNVYLCGFDDSPESRVITPPLTTIHIHSQIMGFSAVHLLISRIQEPSMNYRTIYTETSMIYRESTGD